MCLEVGDYMIKKNSKRYTSDKENKLLLFFERLGIILGIGHIGIHIQHKKVPVGMAKTRHRKSPVTIASFPVSNS